MLDSVLIELREQIISDIKNNWNDWMDECLPYSQLRKDYIHNGEKYHVGIFEMHVDYFITNHELCYFILTRNGKEPLLWSCKNVCALPSLDEYSIGISIWKDGDIEYNYDQKYLPLCRDEIKSMLDLFIGENV